MATLNLTPILTLIRKRDDGSYVFVCAMNDGNGQNRGFRELIVLTDGTVTDSNGTPTGTTLTTNQMNTLNSNWSTYQTGINNIDAAGKLPF